MKKRKLKKSVKIFLLVIMVIMAFFMIPKNKKQEQPKNNDQTKTTIFEIQEQTISEKTDLYTLDIKYPIYNNESIDNIIEIYILKLIHEIKESENKNTLKINYEIFNIENYDYLVIDIDNTLDDNLKYKTYLIDTNKLVVNSYDEILDLEKLKEKIVDKLKNKYSNSVIESIRKTDFNTVDYLVNKDGISICFYDLKPKNMTYVPYINLDNSDLKNILKTNIEITKKYDFDKVKKDKYLALTFDDGPGPYTDEILDILKEYDAHVTFFLVGNRIDDYPSIVKREVDEGHDVASHTYSHKNLTSISKDSVLNQVNSTNLAFNKVTGKQIKYLRPPYGSYNDEVAKLVDMPLIMWNIDTKDWQYLNSTKTSNWVLKKAFNGGIALMHDIHESNIDALKQMLPELEQRGYKFVSISEMADIFNVTLEKGKAYRYIE